MAIFTFDLFVSVLMIDFQQLEQKIRQSKSGTSKKNVSNRRLLDTNSIFILWIIPAVETLSFLEVATREREYGMSKRASVCSYQEMMKLDQRMGSPQLLLVLMAALQLLARLIELFVFGTQKQAILWIAMKAMQTLCMLLLLVQMVKKKKKQSICDEIF